MGGLVAAPGVLVLAGLALVVWQARRAPVGRPVYVALGSSYAAGAGLGRLQQGSPILCARSIAGYPSRLAARLGLPHVDLSCGGATTAHLVRGGQFFQGPQVGVVDGDTRLVTITTGGNDVGYIGDLSMMALRRSGGIAGWLARTFWHGPTPLDRRPYATMAADLDALLHAIRARAPKAQVVVATYPVVLPPTGTCASLRLDADEVAAMRPVAARLATVTRTVAAANGATLVDMNTLGRGHDACSAQPWTHGWSRLSEAPFHPTAAGAQATADAISVALSHSPAGVAAVRQHDASGH